MALNVALIDKSEITKKMISHSLHYYAARVHRFESLEDMQSGFHETQPDIVFIDWDLKKGNRPLAVSAQNQPAPLIVLHRGLSSSALEKMENRLKKPIDAKKLREMVVRLVPKTNQLKIHKFLKYPAPSPSTNKAEEAKAPGWAVEEALDLPDQEGVPSDLIDPSLKADPSLKSVQSAPGPEEAAENYELPSLDKSSGYQIEKTPGGTAQPADASAKFEMSSAPPGGGKAGKSPPPPASIQKTPRQPSSAPPLKEAPQPSPRIFIKEDIDLDEDTANDFAPAALSNPSGADVADTEQNREMILKVLNEYKDTLEFETLMEKALKNYGDKMVKQIIAKDGKETIQKAFSGYRNDPQFKTDMAVFFTEYMEQNPDLKKQMEKSLASFIKKDLPALAKEVIEREIKNLLSEEEEA